ncbi:NP1 gene product [Porcine bocavirus 5/JS677]|uniref:NP1 n=1 Tax=Porcine bocavirus 5/JS677 TaxID=1131622 RepID=UPI000245D7D3|nr:NP1 gene product [Porcine bocavirus 5/JS677]AEX30512.1 NP1 [Porcine bocavirus 5/JS677]
MSQRFSDIKSRSSNRFSPYSRIQARDPRVNERSTTGTEHGTSSSERMETDPNQGSSSRSTKSFGRKQRGSSSQSSGSLVGNRWKSSKMAKKQNPATVFMEHKKREGLDMDLCGFYYHSTRIAGKGTRWIFDVGKKEFQSVARQNCITWDQCRELLFTYKRCLDTMYRSMMYHFRFTECHKCDYWDDFYRQHLAGVTPPETVAPSSVGELSDVEMLEAVESMNES